MTLGSCHASFTLLHVVASFRLRFEVLQNLTTETQDCFFHFHMDKGWVPVETIKTRYQADVEVSFGRAELSPKS